MQGCICSVPLSVLCMHSMRATPLVSLTVGWMQFALCMSVLSHHGVICRTV
jgi:hypothetical protein